jgi:hypothetical protein
MPSESLEKINDETRQKLDQVQGKARRLFVSVPGMNVFKQCM